MNAGQGVFIGVVAVVVVGVLGGSLLLGPAPSTITMATTTTTTSSSTSTSTSTTNPSSSSSESRSGTSTPGQCVTVGEPLFPYPESIPLQGFVQNMQAQYQVTVNETAHTVTVYNPTGGGIGQAAASTLTLQIVAC